MSYKVDRKKSNKICNIMIAAGLAVAIGFGGYTGINILSRMHGMEANNDAIEQVLIKNKDAPSETPTEINESTQISETTEEYTPKYDINALQEKYPNAWGILEKEDGTAFPIVSTNSREEEDYYLKHNLNGEYSSSGTVFLDYQNDKDMNNQVTRLWGHNLYGGDMFGDLTEYQNQGQSFYDQNKTYTLYTNKGVYELSVFAALTEDGTTQEFDYNTQEDFLADMHNNINSSNFTSDVSLEPDNKVMIFECCPDGLTNLYSNQRFSVYSKVTPIYEYNLNNSKTL